MPERVHTSQERAFTGLQWPCQTEDLPNFRRPISSLRGPNQASEGPYQVSMGQARSLRPLLGLRRFIIDLMDLLHEQFF